jgi:hypothetical protein
MITLLVCLLWVALGSAAGNFNKAGRSSMQFLKIGIGARPSSMGEACIANLKDVSSVFWNPAAITAVDKVEAGFSYTKWIGDLNLAAGALGYRVPSVGVFALNYIALDYGDLQEALVTSTTGSADTRTGRLFSGNDFAIGLAFSREYTDKLSIGFNIKYIQEKLFSYSTALWAFDVGTYYETGWKGIRLAVSAQNFARPARWLYSREAYQQTFDLPLLFRLGWSMDLLGGQDLLLGGDPKKQRLSINIDAIHSNDYAERLNLGAEYWLFDLLAVRSGYRINYDEGNFSFGVGLNHCVGSIRLSIDYGYVDYDFLQATDRLSIAVAF